MRTGVFLSASFHAALAFLALYSWPREFQEPPDEINLVDVELIEIGPETNIKAQVAAPEPVETPLPPPAPEPEPVQPQPEEVAALPPRPEPEPAPAEPEPEPAPPPEVVKPEPPKEEPKPKKTPPPVKLALKPKTEPRKKEPEFDLDRIVKSVDKLQKAKAPEQEAALEPQPAARSIEAAGAATAMTAREIDGLRSQLAKCWNVPVGAPRPEDLVVRVTLFLNPDGTVARAPELADSGRLASGNPYFRAAAESAIRAVHICEPYTLPADKYADWNEITITFDPRKMAGL